MIIYFKQLDNSSSISSNNNINNNNNNNNSNSEITTGAGLIDESSGVTVS